MRALLLLIALGACDRAAPRAEQAGDRLEAAARGAGLVADPGGSLVGAWARDTASSTRSMCSNRACSVQMAPISGSV